MPTTLQSSRPSPIPAPPPATLDADTAVLFFGIDWNAENRTSSHHLAGELAKRFRVFYIECPGYRAPTRSARDVKKVFAKLGRFIRGTRRGPNGLQYRTLLQLPFHRFAAVRWLNRLLVRATVRWSMWRNGIRRPVTWFHVPHVPSLVGTLGERLSVYYCVDDFAAYPGVNPTAIRSMDDETARRADVVFVTSETLVERKRGLNPATHVSPHGVEFDHFARAQDQALPIPADVARLTGPVVGFFGQIQSFIDLEMIDWMAAERPAWHFVLIGHVGVPSGTLPVRPNVHFLGKRPYAELPGYAKRFDACLIPYKSGAWSHHANPLKLREYLATGKPVVSVDTPEVAKFADAVEVAPTREEFLAHLDRVLAGEPDPTRTAHRMARVAGTSWSARADAVVQTIRESLATKHV
jgi:glycosyltransferase involved in cell wall biosynthesis